MLTGGVGVGANAGAIRVVYHSPVLTTTIDYGLKPCATPHSKIKVQVHFRRRSERGNHLLVLVTQ